jgi:hypothetical protein
MIGGGASIHRATITLIDDTHQNGNTHIIYTAVGKISGK